MEDGEELWKNMVLQPDGQYQLEDGGLSQWLPAQIEGPDALDPVSDAHRAVLNRHRVRVESLSGYGEYLPDARVCNECSRENAVGFEDIKYWPCDTWRDIALAYQYNDGYREEWRP